MEKVVLRGPCALYSGWSRAFRAVASRLKRWFSVELQPLDNLVAPGFPLPVAEVPRGGLVGIVFGRPWHLQQLSTPYKVLFTMCETSDVPRQWSVELSDADEVWVPSTFCREVLSCYARRVRVLPLGYDDALFGPGDFSRGRREEFWQRVCPQAAGSAVVGTVGVSSKRKGTDLFVRAVAELRARGCDVVGVIKTRDTRWLPPLGDGVWVVEGDWSDEQIVEFYRACDVLAFPTRGEGFGLPPLEGVACGRPVLVTRATGPLDYIDDRGVYGIEVAGTAPAEGTSARGSYWVEPSLPDLVDKLERLLYTRAKPEHRYRQWSASSIAEEWAGQIGVSLRRAQAKVGAGRRSR